MDTVIQQFRTAIGGFNRKDVQEYIEELTARFRKEKEELQARLDASEQKCADLAANIETLKSEKDGVSAEEAKIRSSLEESTLTLTKLRGEQTVTQSKLAAAERDREAFRTKLEELQPYAESYLQLKDRVATVELDAHRKAQAVLDEASKDADEIRGSARAWLSGVMEQYEALRKGMDGLMAQAKALGLLEEQTGPLEEQASRLKELGGIQ